MDSIYEILDEIDRSNKKGILATVIKVEGSAYRKEGTTMLFMENGRKIGIISAGCLEADLEIQANKLLNEHATRSRKIVYDMSSEDDLSWGRGAGCNGKVHILMEEVDSELRNHLRNLRNYLNQGTPVIALKILKDDYSAVQSMFVTKDHHVFGQAIIDSKLLLGMVTQTEISYVRYVNELRSNVYIHFFRPKPRLFIFGAGPDVIPFISMATMTGFSVGIWDWRATYINEVKCLDAYLIHDLSISKTIDKMNFVFGDSVIIMTHDFQKDKEILHAILAYKQQLSYLGVLGPRKRTSRLLNGAAIPEHLHSPVGLAIGADGPEEIAISIIADLIQTQRQMSNERRIFFEEKQNSRYISGGGEK